MHADDRTLVALCADLRACGAAMPAAVSVVATWAAEHSLSISADSNGAVLFCIASHRQSDEDTADHRLGGGNPRVKSHPVSLPGNAIDRLLIFGLHVTATAAHHRSSRVSSKDTSVHLTASPAPLRRIVGCRAPHGTNASRVSVILRTCVAQSARKPHPRQYLGRQRRPFRCREMPSSRNCDASAATWGSPRTTSAPLLLSTEFSPGTL
ncbi:hypothetical protein TcCL_Unassigned04771 [Trypanosoma cruzi]|nr:hypothetical protein TcCL_Unassigned04771 [Trypanosoma cruzi]